MGNGAQQKWLNFKLVESGCVVGRRGIPAGLAKREASLWVKMQKESVEEMGTIMGNRGVAKRCLGTKGEIQKGQRPAGAPI